METDQSEASGIESPGFKVVAFAASLGGIQALRTVLSTLPADFPAAIAIVQHRADQMPFLLPQVLGKGVAIPVTQAREGMLLRPATAIVAPPGVHMLVEKAGNVVLRDGPKVKWVRPAADPLFESLAESFGSKVIAVILTGGDGDGSEGAVVVQKAGGTVIVQDPNTARAPSMPLSAIDTGAVDLVLPLDQIGHWLQQLVRTCD